MRLIKPLASDPPLVLTTFENVTLIVQLVFPPQDLHPLNPLFLPQTTPSRVALAYQKLRRNSATCIWRRPQRRSDETKRRLEAKVFEERVALIKWREELQRWDLCLVVVTIMMMYVWEQRKGCKGLTTWGLWSVKIKLWRAKYSLEEVERQEEQADREVDRIMAERDKVWWRIGDAYLCLCSSESIQKIVTVDLQWGGKEPPICQHFCSKFLHEQNNDSFRQIMRSMQRGMLPQEHS